MMNFKDRNKIDQNIDQLVQLVDMTTLWPKIENNIFFPGYPEISKWKNNWNSSEVKKNILLEIKTRGPEAYTHLINGLTTTNQHCCIELLQNTTPSAIEVIRATNLYGLNPNENPRNIYRMRSNPRGRVLLISLIKYSLPHEERIAAERDEENLQHLFEQMGFHVQIELNLTSYEIRQKTEEFSKNPKLQSVDSAFIIICGHGSSNSTGDDSIIWGVEHFNEGVSCNEIIDYFVPEKCPYLKNKPKVFIFQICRGSHIQGAVKKDMYKNIPLRFNLGIGKSNFDYSDIFIAHSTLPDCVSYRDVDKGSWFIQSCCEIFAKHACEHHVEDLLTLVDKKMRSLPTSANSEVGRFLSCQTSSQKYSNFKKCFINPGL